MNEHLGFAHFWAQGDALTHAVALALLLMSALSWYVMLDKLLTHLRLATRTAAALAAFWDATTPAAALTALRAHDRSGLFAQVAQDALAAADSHDQHAARGIGAGVGKSDYVARALQQSLVTAQARTERGMTLLASVGSTAPFVGLFGTVWGIYHALIGLSGATQVVLDKVAGPVGEALIMTAAGLFVAVPAVLAFNACARANRLMLARLEGFAHAVHAWTVSGLRSPGASGTATATATAQPAPAGAAR